MSNKKPTYNEIVKALKKTKYRVDGIALRGFYLDTEMFNQVVDLINHLQEEKETLINGQETLQKYIAEQKVENERLKSCVKTEKEVREIAKRTMEPLVKEITREQIDIAVKLAKIEAYKECIEKVKEKSSKINMCRYGIVVKTDYQISDKSLDNLLKELERKEGTTYDD